MDLAGSLARLAEARRLADGGRHQALVEFLRGAPAEELRRSATLALLGGIALARLGRHAEGERWLERARAGGDAEIGAHALNVLGVIALERGDVDRAARHFEDAIAEASRAGDDATLGRAAMNLGVLANVRGEHDAALALYALALAACERGGFRRGIADVRHNMAITRLDQGRLDEALHAANRAIEAAIQAGDETVAAQALAGRAEIRVALGDAILARREAERALASHRALGDGVREAEDLRILAATARAAGERDEAERLLRDVLKRAGQQRRPLLGAAAARDLANLLAESGRSEEARTQAMVARDAFTRLGARAEVEKLKRLIEV